MDNLGTDKMLEEEIRTQMRDLSRLSTGSDEKSRAIDDLVALYRLKIEEGKAVWDSDEKAARLAMDRNQSEEENVQKQAQMEEQKKDRYFRLGVDTAGIVLPLIFYAVWMRRGFKFEETGTFTSSTFRGLINRFKPMGK